MSSKISAVCRKLVPEREKGFEGLIAQLLEALTGHHFHLAKSGEPIPLR